MKKLVSLVLVALLLTSSIAFAKEVHVKGYTRKDGTQVDSYTRSAPHSKGSSSEPLTSSGIDGSYYETGSTKTSGFDSDPHESTYENRYNRDDYYKRTLKAGSIAIDGIAFNPEGKNSAFINGKAVDEGGTIDNVKVNKINKDSVEIEFKGKKKSLKVGDILDE